jgi:hypothetical protein
MVYFKLAFFLVILLTQLNAQTFTIESYLSS